MRWWRQNEHREPAVDPDEPADPQAMYRRGHQEGGAGAKERWWTTAAERGHRVAMHDLGVLLEKQHRPEEALVWFRRAADAGHPLAAASIERIGPAVERWQSDVGPRLAELRSRAEAGDVGAMAAYGNELWARHTSEEAVDWLDRAAEAGDTTAMARLAWHRARRRDLGGAERWLRRRAELTGAAGWRELAEHHRRHHQDAAAESAYRQALAAGDDGSLTALADLLAGGGRVEEAEPLYQRAAERGDPAAMAARGRLLLDRGAVADAEPLLRRAAAQGHGEIDLGRLLRERGDLPAAEEVLRDLADDDDPDALLELGLVREAAGDLENAAELFAVASLRAGDRADCLSMRVEATLRGDTDAATEWTAKARTAPS